MLKGSTKDHRAPAKGELPGRAWFRGQGGTAQVGAAPRRIPQEEWTLALVKTRLQEAADVLRRMKASRHTWPEGYRSAWPDVVQTFWDAYGYSDARARPIPPTPREIDRMDAALDWFHWLERDERYVVWMRAFRITWRRMQERDGRSERTLRTIHRDALLKIYARLAGRE